MAIVSELEEKNLWRSFSNALGAEYQAVDAVRGHSGINHQIQALAVDEVHSRLIVVSSEPNSRIAALVQGDVQSAYPEKNVLLVRPIVIDLSAIAKKVFQSIEFAELGPVELEALGTYLKALQENPADITKSEKSDRLKNLSPEALVKAFDAIGKAFNHVYLPPVDQIVSVIQQASNIDWDVFKNSIASDAQKPIFSFGKLLEFDALAADRSLGVCPLPLYEFTENDWDLFFNSRTEDIQQRLQDLNIYQYFYPSPDHLTLGFVERGLSKEAEVKDAVDAAPSIGHPFGRMEIISANDIAGILDGLKGAGYVAEGEYGIEITPTGDTVRSTIKFRPREGVITRILNRISLNLSLSGKDFLGPR